jgi:crossover junction endodeoxyribonuclease RuvC
MSKIFLGIDPGLSGAFAFYNSVDRHLEIVDMPVTEVTRNGKTKRELSASLVASAVAGRKIEFAVVERVGAMPGQGVTSVFSFGKSAGIVEGVLAAYEIPTHFATPQAWQKIFGVRAGKDGSRECAMRLFPWCAEYFQRKKDDGRSDAALIALYCAKIWDEKST